MTPVSTRGGPRSRWRIRQHSLACSARTGHATKRKSRDRAASRAPRTAASACAGDGDLERLTDLAHSLIAESAEALDQRADGDAFDRIEIDGRPPRDWILCRLEQHLARKATDRC